MAIIKKPFINPVTGLEDPDKEVISSDAGFSIVEFPSGIIYLNKLVVKKDESHYYMELISEAGLIPQDRLEPEDIEVV